MEGKAKVVVYIDGKEPVELEGDFVFCICTKEDDDGGVTTSGTIHASASAEVIGRAIAEIEQQVNDIKNNDLDVAFKALEWKLQLAEKRCDELLKQCEEIIAGDDDEHF